MEISVRHDVYIHLSGDDEINVKLDRILAAVTTMEDSMAGELDVLVKEVQDNAAVTDSAIVLLNGLHQKLVEAANDPVKLAAITAELDAKTNALAAAVTANTDSA